MLEIQEILLAVHSFVPVLQILLGTLLSNTPGKEDFHILCVKRFKNGLYRDFKWLQTLKEFFAQVGLNDAVAALGPIRRKQQQEEIACKQSR